MTTNPVTPFRMFKNFVEFYPRLGATIALGAMDAATKMIPTSRAGVSDEPREERRPELVTPPKISGPQKRSSSRQRKPANKRRVRASKRATGRRQAD